MNVRIPESISRRRSESRAWLDRRIALAALCALGTILLPVTAGAHPQTREGFFLGLGLAKGSMAQTSDGVSSDRIGGSGGTFRFGWVINPKFALGLENNSWVTSDASGAAAVGTSTFAASVFPAEGLVLRAGIGAGYGGGAGDGLSGDYGLGWTVGAAYEFRVARTFAIGPQIDYAHASFSYVEQNFVNLGLSMNWYFIPK